MFFIRFYPKSNWSTKLFLFGLNLELQEAAKSEAPKINFIISKLLKSKNPPGFVIPVLKVSVTNPRGFFDLIWSFKLLFNRVDFRASDFEAALQLQIEAKQKKLGWSVTLGVKSVEKHLIRGTLKNLTTPTMHTCEFGKVDKVIGVTRLIWSSHAAKQ